jgi:hypothetical protein
LPPCCSAAAAIWQAASRSETKATDLGSLFISQFPADATAGR